MRPLSSLILLGFALQDDFATSGYSFNHKYRQSMDDLGASDNFSDLAGNASFPVTFDRDTFALRLDGAHTFGTRPVERSFGLSVTNQT